MFLLLKPIDYTDQSAVTLASALGASCALLQALNSCIKASTVSANMLTNTGNMAMAMGYPTTGLVFCQLNCI